MALRLDRAEVGEPLVVDAVPHAQQLEVVALLVAEEGPERLEWDRLAVLTAVEDHLRGHAVVVEVAHRACTSWWPSVFWLRATRWACASVLRIVARTLLTCSANALELAPVPLGTILPQLLLEPWADVRVGRHDDERHALSFHGSPPADARRSRVSVASDCIGVA